MATLIQCDHRATMRIPSSNLHVCQDCLKLNDEWVHLRLCTACGYVGCCDSSKNKHATKHFHHSTHPIIASQEPGERWKWCYVDEVAWE